MAVLAASSPKQQKAVDVFQEVEILILGGAMFGGKSYLASLLSVLYADDPNSRIAVFRNTLEMMKQGGGIIDTIQSVYDKIEDVCKLDISGNPPVGRIISGPGAGAKRGKGCKFNFLPMQHEKDMEKIRGGAYSLAIVEEAIPFFTREQIEMIMSRLRSESKHPSRMIITCNPSPKHFICDLIKDYYLDEEGYAIEERSGDIRYFYNHMGEYIWGNSKEEVYQIAEEAGAYENEHIPLSKEERINRIMSFSFVQLTAKDNPIGMALNPKYMAQLEAMDPVKKARNLYGNWFIEPENTGVFKRQWIRGENGERVIKLKDLPEGCTAMRGVDKAHSVPSEVNPNPDFTAISPLFLKDKNGFYYLLGNYLQECSDIPVRKSDKRILGRFRRLAGARDTLIAAQLNQDKDLSSLYKYSEPRLVIPKDSGAGTGDFNATVSLMVEKGIKVIKDKTAGNVSGKKLMDFLGFCNACENGMVFIVEESFINCPNGRETLDYIWKELEQFDGVTASTQLRKDDFVDAFSVAFNALASSKKPYQTIIRNQRRVETLSSGLNKRD